MGRSGQLVDGTEGLTCPCWGQSPLSQAPPAKGEWGWWSHAVPWLPAGRRVPPCIDVAVPRQLGLPSLDTPCRLHSKDGLLLIWGFSILVRAVGLVDVSMCGCGACSVFVCVCLLAQAAVMGFCSLPARSHRPLSPPDCGGWESGCGRRPGESCFPACTRHLLAAPTSQSADHFSASSSLRALIPFLRTPRGPIYHSPPLQVPLHMPSHWTLWSQHRNWGDVDIQSVVCMCGLYGCVMCVEPERHHPARHAVAPGGLLGSEGTT